MAGTPWFAVRYSADVLTVSTIGAEKSMKLTEEFVQVGIEILDVELPTVLDILLCVDE